MNALRHPKFAWAVRVYPEQLLARVEAYETAKPQINALQQLQVSRESSYIGKLPEELVNVICDYLPEFKYVETLDQWHRLVRCCQRDCIFGDVSDHLDWAEDRARSKMSDLDELASDAGLIDVLDDTLDRGLELITLAENKRHYQALSKHLDRLSQIQEALQSEETTQSLGVNAFMTLHKRYINKDGSRSDESRMSEYNQSSIMLHSIDVRAYLVLPVVDAQLVASEPHNPGTQFDDSVDVQEPLSGGFTRPINKAEQQLFAKALEKFELKPWNGSFEYNDHWWEHRSETLRVRNGFSSRQDALIWYMKPVRAMLKPRFEILREQ